MTGALPQDKVLSVPIQVGIEVLLLFFWTIFSISYHPTFIIDLLVTLTLLVFYLIEIYFHQIVLIPRFFRSHRYVWYVGLLLISMLLLTFVGVAIIRSIYTNLWDPDQLGDYWQHYGIDFFGMAVHVVGAAMLLWIVSRFKRKNSLQRI